MRFNDIVAKLTNWQRNQWAKAGYPGLRRKDVSKVELYLEKKHGS